MMMMYWGMSGSESGVAHIIIHMNYDQENIILYLTNSMTPQHNAGRIQLLDDVYQS